MSEDMRAVLIKAMQAHLERLRERLEECEDLLAAYAVDENEAFPAEVDGYFKRYNIKHEEGAV